MRTYTKIPVQAALWSCLCSVSLLVGCLYDIPSIESPDTVLDDAGVVISKTPIWKKDISEARYYYATIQPIFYENKVVVPGSLASGEDILMALDTATGEEIWRWNDYVEGYNFGTILSRELHNRKGNIAIYINGNLFCAVNLDDGTTLWKEKRTRSSNSTHIVGNEYYYPGVQEFKGIKEQFLMKGDLYSSHHERVVKLPLDSIQLFSGSYGGFYHPLIYQENNETLAFLPFSDNLDIYNAQSYNNYMLYNISKEAFISEKVRLPDITNITTVLPPVMVQGFFVFAAGNFIYGVEKATMQIAWTRKYFAGAQSDGSFMLQTYKGRLFAANRTGLRRLVLELNPVTGETLWIDKGRGGSIKPVIHFLNDVMYFISRGDGYIYAYDVNSRALLWKLESPDYEYFMGLRVHKAASATEKDMLVACSWKNAYRFEPAR